MARDKDLKRRVRERMQRTGESYSIARHHLLAQERVAPSATWSAPSMIDRDRAGAWERLLAHVRQAPGEPEGLRAWLDGFDRWTWLDVELDPAVDLYPRLCIAFARAANIAHPRAGEALERAKELLEEGDQPDRERFEAFIEELDGTIPDDAPADHPLLLLMEAVSDPAERLKGEHARTLLTTALEACRPNALRAVIEADLLAYLEERGPQAERARGSDPTVPSRPAPRLTELRRAWRATRSVVDEERLLRHALATGTLEARGLELSAFLQHPAALLLVKSNPDVERKRAAFGRWGANGAPTRLLCLEPAAAPPVEDAGDDPVAALLDRLDSPFNLEFEALEPGDPRRNLGGFSLKPEDHLTEEQLALWGPELARMGFSTNAEEGEAFGWFINLTWWGDEVLLRGAVAAARAAQGVTTSAAGGEAVAAGDRFLACPCMDHGREAQLAGRAALAAARAAGGDRDLMPGTSPAYDATAAASQAAKAAHLVATGLSDVLKSAAAQTVRYALAAVGAAAVKDRLREELVGWALGPAWGDPA